VTLRIATRRSQLALAQARWVKQRLEELEPGLTVELREYVTTGDRVLDVPLAQAGRKGLFTREIEEALLAGEADVAVHSLKDLPGALPPGLLLGAVPEREDPRDALVAPGPAAAGESLQALPAGARLGSSSLRRGAQLLHLRPDLRVESIRGNVDTRLRKLDEGQYDGLVLAAAGLRRLGLAHRISACLSPEECTPAPGQGALGIECRAGDAAAAALLARLDHGPTRAAVTAERSLMVELGGGCSIPLGAFARPAGDSLRLIAVVAAPDGSRLVGAALDDAPASEPELAGRLVAERLREGGAAELLRGRA